jgi:adenylate kinase family enzyme
MGYHDIITLTPFGKRGAGKDHGGERISAFLSGYGIRCQTADFGGELRREVAARTSLGRKIARDLSLGRLIPEKQARYIMQRIYTRCMSHSPDVIIVSGFPRREEQADYFYRSIAVGRRVGFFIDRPEEVCLKQALSRKRPDDTEELLRAGFARFEEFERPAIERMRQLGMRYVHVTPGKGDFDPYIPNILHELRIAQHFRISLEEEKEEAV